MVSQGLDVQELLAVVGREISQIFTPEGAAEAEIQVVIGIVRGPRLTVRMITDAVEDCMANPEDEPAASDGIFETDYVLNLETPVGQVIDQSKPKILKKVNVQDLFQRTTEPGSALHAGRDRGHTGRQEGTRRLPGRRSRERPELA